MSSVMSQQYGVFWATAQLNEGMVKESIDSYIKSDDASTSTAVIEYAKISGKMWKFFWAVFLPENA